MEMYRRLLSEAPDESISIVQSLDEAVESIGKDGTVVFSGTHYAEYFKNAGFEVWVGVEAEPALETVKKMIAFLAEKRPQQVAAVGGGSVLDAAKAAYLSWQTGWDTEALFGVNQWSSANPGKKLKRMIAIPTTSGTGSEATPYSNIVDHSAGVKKLIVENESVPAKAFIIPQLTNSMPKALTRATGCDALAHLIEGFLNVGADGKCGNANSWALAGIGLIKKYLLRCLNDPDDGEAREALAAASALGGMTIRFKSTGLPHLCSFSWFGRIAHGDAVAMLLPAAWRYYLGNPAVGCRTMELAEIFPGKTPSEVIDSYREFISLAGLPEKLSAWEGITPELLELTANSGSKNKMKLELAPNPVPQEKSYEVLSSILFNS